MANAMLKLSCNRALHPSASCVENQVKERVKMTSEGAVTTAVGTKTGKNEVKERQDGNSVIRPYPYFYYQDYSTKPDPDPTIPLTSIGKVPSFPAKMHSILSRADFQDVISWMPHGRAWRVHKPKEFESRIIPMYFEHIKYSSFVRQANGWGFNRITVDSSDRNAYYHPMFLRGLPHLCKAMKRPGISKKHSTSPENEPNLYEISRQFPVPDKVVDDSALLTYNVNGVPISQIPVLKINSAYSTKLLPPGDQRPSSFTQLFDCPSTVTHKNPIVAKSSISDQPFMAQTFEHFNTFGKRSYELY